MEDALWPFVWLVPHAVILFGLWRGSRIAWAVLVSISATLTIALAMVCVGTLFGSGFFLNIYWWGPTAHGASADLHGNPYRYFRVKALELEPSAPSTFLAG